MIYNDFFNESKTSPLERGKVSDKGEADYHKRGVCSQGADHQQNFNTLIKTLTHP